MSRVVRQTNVARLDCTISVRCTFITFTRQKGGKDRWYTVGFHDLMWEDWHALHCLISLDMITVVLVWTMIYDQG